MKHSTSVIVASAIACSCTYINDEYREQPISAHEAVALSSIEDDIDRRFSADVAKIEEARARQQQRKRDAWTSLGMALLGGYMAYDVIRDLARADVQPPRPSPAARPSIVDLCLGGNPRVSREVTSRGRKVAHTGFTALYGDDLHVPMWVCEHLEATDLQGPATQCDDCFRLDPLVPADVQASSADYYGSGFSRAHLAAPGNFRHDQDEMDTSFLFTNIVPRVGEGSEQRVWEALDEAVREYACAYGEVWIITGIGFEGKRVIGSKRVAVPNAFYKIVMRRNESGYRALAFSIENKSHDTVDISQFMVSISDIEQEFEVDLVPELKGGVVEEQPASWRRSDDCIGNTTVTPQPR